MAFQHFQDLKHFRHDLYYHVNTLIELANVHNGVVVGDFLYNVIVPVKELNKSLYQCDFEHVDFWFKSISNANCFIKEACLESKNITEQSYYSLFKGERGVHVNIHVSKTHPDCLSTILDGPLI